MKVEYNETNNTIKIVDITAKEASLISLAFKSPLVVAAIGRPLIDSFNDLKDKAAKASQR
jgi:hypothetical protein